MTRFYRIVRGLLTPLAYLFFHLRVRGVENVLTAKDKGFVLCCNHTSLTDIWLLIVLCPRQIQFMAKEELFRRRFAGWIFRRMGAFPVNRHSADLTAVRHANELVKKGGILGIFPEGTRHYGVPPQKAKPGAAMIALRTGADVLPVSIHRRGKKVSLFQTVTVRFGKVIENSSYASKKNDVVSKSDIRRLSEDIMERITELWGCTD